MIPEIATIEIDAARGADFEAAVMRAKPLFDSAPGCLDMALHRSIEAPGRYRLIVGWATLDAHTVDFRGSAAFQEWRALAGPFFVSPPAVEHLVEVVPAAA